MNLPAIRARLIRQIAIEREHRRSTAGLEAVLRDLTHADLRQAPQRAGRAKKKELAA